MIISCDTSSAVCSVAVADKGQILFKKEATGGQIHIEKLAPFLQEALTFCTSKQRSPDAFALAIGPGSFNGLRIGLATMKALALVFDLPLIPIPSTDALALGMSNRVSGLSRAVIFSHRNFIHYADYSLSKGNVISSPEFHYESWDNLYSEEIIHYFGTADRGFGDWLEGRGAAAHVVEKFHATQANAGHVALLAELRQTMDLKDLDELEPFYNVRYEAKKWEPPNFL